MSRKKYNCNFCGVVIVSKFHANTAVRCEACKTRYCSYVCFCTHLQESEECEKRCKEDWDESPQELANEELRERSMQICLRSARSEANDTL